MPKSSNSPYTVKLKFTVEGHNEILQKLRNIENQIVPLGIDSALSQVAENVINVSRQILNQNSVTGNLQNAITKSIPISTDNGSQITVYVDNSRAVGPAGVPYALFVYYGTGKYREGQLYGLHQAAKGWWIVSQDKIGSNQGYDYSFQKGNMMYYYFTGTKAIHFLEDAERNTRGKNLSTIRNVLQDYIKRGL